MIISPCISICKTDPTTGYCYGCGRNNEEKKTWKLEETTDDWKSNNLEEIKKRLSGWQLDSFNESYEYKINISNLREFVKMKNFCISIFSLFMIDIYLKKGKSFS